MFYNPYGFINLNYFRNPVDQGYVRILHASPGAPSVDVYANDVIIARNLKYKDFTSYLTLVPGCYTINVYPSGTTVNPIIQSFLCITPGSILTAAVIDQLPNVSLITIPEPTMYPKVIGATYVRFANLAPGSPEVDVLTSDGKSIFKNVEYKEVTPYVQVSPGTYNFTLVQSGTNKSLLYVPNQRLGPNRFYTIYAVGLLSGNPPLQALVPLDGISYIKLSSDS